MSDLGKSKFCTVCHRNLSGDRIIQYINDQPYCYFCHDELMKQHKSEKKPKEKKYRLKHGSRRVIRLYREEGYTPTQVAKMTGKTVEEVYTILSGREGRKLEEKESE